MQVKDVQLKRALRTAMLVLLLSAVGMGKMYASYDFSAVCETGQTLYYNIIDAENHYVELTCPGTSGSNSWSGFTKPTGEIILPESVQYEDVSYIVTSIGNYAFYNCRDLTGSLTIPNSVALIGNSAFHACRGLTGSLTIPNSVTSIGNSAFNTCSGLTGSLTIPNSVTSIGSFAFCGCSGFVGSLTIPNSVTSIGINPFAPCNGLESLIVEIGNAFYDSRENCNAIIKTSTNELVSGCKSTIIPNSVTTIGDQAFSGCNGLTGSLTIPNSVISIGNSAFYSCSGLTGNLTIPNSVTSIGNSAFYRCTGLTGSLTIPNSVTSIGNSAFYWCYGFTGDLTIGNSVTTIGSSAFSGCSGFTGSLTIPNSVTSIGNSAFQNCSGFTGGLIIPNSVTMIGDWTFSACNGLTGSLTIPNSVTSIGIGAFSNCSGFTGSLTIPNSVITIGENAFTSCSGLTGCLTIPNSVITIGESAFTFCELESIIVESGNTVYDSRENCNAIIKTSTNELVSGCKNTIIPNSVTSIGNNAFRGCSFSGNFIIPNSVTSIGNDAFYFCNGLTEIMMLGTTPPSLNTLSSLSGPFTTNYVYPIYVPYESLNDYKTATIWSRYQSRIFPWLQKSIEGYSEDAGKWHFIASPIVANTAPTAVDNMITETAYDLYRFDQSEDLEWRNYEYPENTQDFMLVNGQGYLYANEDDVNLIFKGNFNEDDTKEVALVYDANADLPGWNLVGNPFPVSAYADRSYYVMNEDGTAIEPTTVSSTTAITPCTGVMVKAETTGESVIFSKTAPEAAVNQGVLQIAVANANTRSHAVEDKAIVSFNADDALEKFVFNKENAQICIPQNGKDYAIAYAEKTGEIPVNFKAAKNGTYTINVNANDMEFNYLHLIDNLTGADVDLFLLCKGGQGDSTTQPATYTFTAKTSDYASRFRLVFSVCGDADDDDETPFAFVNNGEIVITADISDATLQIVDMMGRVVVSVGGRTRCVPTAGMAPGVYILRLINGDDVKTQKVVIR